MHTLELCCSLFQLALVTKSACTADIRLLESTRTVTSLPFRNPDLTWLVSAAGSPSTSPTRCLKRTVLLAAFTPKGSFLGQKAAICPQSQQKKHCSSLLVLDIVWKELPKPPRPPASTLGRGCGFIPIVSEIIVISPLSCLFSCCWIPLSQFDH